MGTVAKRDGYKTGYLTAQPGSRKAQNETASGLQPLLLNQKKECLLYVPANYDPGTPAALALMLHGAGGVAAHGISYIQGYADAKNIILLSPASHDYSWDIIAADSFGTDVIFIDHALSYVFDRFSIDPSRVAIGGFSDGASYALSIGLGNGDLFTHIIAFSPGFYYTFENMGKPSVYISHGKADDVLPIDSCSRRIIPKLKREGLAIVYEEFDGRHEIPPSISKGAVDWFRP
ncbi:MAG: phospholipase [Flavisolibacter sp.]|jgi:phospholipase/carboxylesterase|nr:phospholipase [Flavisolibacter sp.]